MKAVALLASPRRHGNSSGLAERLMLTLGKSGQETTTYFLNTLSYKGCQACTGCKTRSETCVLLDDLTPVLEDVKGADTVVLASPVYWGDVSSQLKAFIDRTYSYLTPEFIAGPVRHRLESGKRLVFILSQGADEALYGDIFPRYNAFFEELGLFDETYLIRGCELSEREDHQHREDLLAQVDRTAALLQRQ